MKVSVIIPSHNRPEYLREAIQSALDQDWRDKEIIVIDDGSTEDMLGVEKWARSWGVQFYFKANGGISSVMNLALDLIDSELITVIHDDDKFHDEVSLSARVAPFIFDPDLEVVWTQAVDIDKDGKEIGFHKAGPPDKELIWRADYLYMPCFCWKPSIHKKIGPFDERLISNEDYPFKIKCIMECKCFFVERPTLKYRRHPQNKSTVNAGLMDHYRDIFMADLKRRYGR